MMDDRTLWQIRQHLERFAPQQSAQYRQSRRLEGQIDRGGDCQRYGVVHVWLEQGLDGREPAVLQILRVTLDVQNRDHRDPSTVELRGFPQRDTGADRTRVSVPGPISAAGLGTQVTDVAAGTVARPAAVHPRPRPDDLVLILSRRLDAILTPEVLAFAALADPRRALRVGLDDGGWGVHGRLVAAPVKQLPALAGSADKESEMDKFVATLNRQVCEYLWSMTSEVTSIVHDDKLPAQNLIWPAYRSGDQGAPARARCSEQEARFAMAIALSRDPTRYFSVETPTRATYKFTGQTPISAQTDLTVFRREDGGLIRDLNVEFKAHQPTQASVSKDMEKLLREPVAGCWFHVIANADRGTLEALFTKMRVGAQEASGRQLCRDDGQGAMIYLCFCCVASEPPWALFASASRKDLLEGSADILNTVRVAPGGWTLWTTGVESEVLHKIRRAATGAEG
jgi:hypothetical protein